MSVLNIVGFDPSMTNWGIAYGTYDLASGLVEIPRLEVLNATTPTGKQVRQNSKDLSTAKQLARGSIDAARGADAVFVEVPHGSQSARAMASYGLCVGILGSLRSMGIPFFEVTAGEVKAIATGRKSATKLEMIGWATALHPEANWPMQMKHGQEILVEGKAEHMADAIGAIHAGMATDTFQQTLAFMKQSA